MKAGIWMVAGLALLAGCAPKESGIGATPPSQATTGSEPSHDATKESAPKDPGQVGTKPADPSHAVSKTTDEPGDTEPATMPGDERSKLFVWSDTDEHALQEAKASGKYVVLKMETTWSPQCKIMNHEAFQDPEYAKLVKDAIFVPIDVETDYGKKMAKKWDTGTVPIMHFLRPDGKEFGFILGYQDVPLLIKKTKRVLAQR
ncbi:MAG: DUF255 domain-containing protein [Armatimonadetes bacterium]|nr:DUF255 domain-containing protein [Armatimonadota bacterium]